jgi:hypothetical protein
MRVRSSFDLMFSRGRDVTVLFSSQVWHLGGFEKKDWGMVVVFEWFMV